MDKASVSAERVESFATPGGDQQHMNVRSNSMDADRSQMRCVAVAVATVTLVVATDSDMESSSNALLVFGGTLLSLFLCVVSC